MTRNFIIIFIVAISCQLSAQNSAIDSVTALLENASKVADQIKYKCKLSELNSELGEFIAAENMAQEALKLAEELESKVGIAQAFYSMGRLSLYKGHLTESLYYLESALSRFEELELNKEKAWSYLNLGITLQAQKGF